MPLAMLGPEVGGDQFSLPTTSTILRFYVSFTLRLRTLQDDHATTSGTWCGAGFTVWVLVISGCPSLDHHPLDHPPLGPPSEAAGGGGSQYNLREAQSRTLGGLWP